MVYNNHAYNFGNPCYHTTYFDWTATNEGENYWTRNFIIPFMYLKQKARKYFHETESCRVTVTYQ